MEERWMNSREAAEYLNFKDYKRITELAKKGKIPAHQLPGHVGWRFRRSELDACMVPNGYNAPTCADESHIGE